MSLLCGAEKFWGFIHSFIDSSIYIAPLKGKLLRGAPDSSWSKRTVLKRLYNVSENDLGSNRNSRGRPFHMTGPTTFTFTSLPRLNSFWMCVLLEPCSSVCQHRA